MFPSRILYRSYGVYAIAPRYTRRHDRTIRIEVWNKTFPGHSFVRVLVGGVRRPFRAAKVRSLHAVRLTVTVFQTVCRTQIDAGFSRRKRDFNIENDLTTNLIRRLTPTRFRRTSLPRPRNVARPVTVWFEFESGVVCTRLMARIENYRRSVTRFSRKHGHGAQ